jgi:hypothetical protein
MQELNSTEIDAVAAGGFLDIADAVIDFVKGFWQGAKDAYGSGSGSGSGSSK